LDQVLVEAAVEAGAELRTGFRVLEYIPEGGRITGIRGGGHDGRGVTEHAIVTVGADGRRSLLARTVHAPRYDATPPFTCWYFSCWSGLGDRGLEVYLRDQKVIIAFPTNDGLTGIFVAWPAAQVDQVRRDIEASFLAALDEVPELCERVRAGRREERFLGATDLPNFFRTRSGRGGRWSATPDFTRTRTWPWASPTRSATPSCWPRPSTRVCPAAGRSRRPWPRTSRPATSPPAPTTGSIWSWPGSRLCRRT